MAGELLLGVDIGTYSSKGVLCGPDGHVLAEATIEHGLSLPRPGWAEHDADAIWWGEFVALTRTLLGDRYRGEDVGGVAVSAIGACVLPVDAAGRPLRMGILYGIDTRAPEEIAWLNEHFGEEPMFALGGMALTSQAIGPKILWMKRREPDVYAAARMFFGSSSYMVYRLTGEYVMDYHTASYYNPLFDLRNLRWDPRFAEPIVELDRLPRLLWSDEIAGEVTPAAAAETGLKLGTPVTAGTIDAAAEAVSVGVVDPGDMMVMYGTTMFFIHVTGDPVPDPRMWATAFALPGRYSIDGGMSTTGALTRWFRDTLGGEEMVAEAAGGPNAYAALADAAGTISPGAEGLICLPYFAGERTPINDPDARGVYAGLTLTHTKAHLYRASLEGTAYGVRHNLETMAAMGAPPRRLVAVGGGAKNPLWLQIVSDVSGLPQDVPERTIGASYGDAFLAGLGTGIVPGLDALTRDWVKLSLQLQPTVDLRPVYDAYYDVYRNLYESAKDQLHALARLGSTGV
jgi:xylulokinase